MPIRPVDQSKPTEKPITEEYPIATEAAKGAATGAGIYGVARAARPAFQAMQRVPAAGLPGAAIRGIGKVGEAIGKAPIESTLAGGAAGAGSETARALGLSEPYASLVGVGAGFIPGLSRIGARSMYESFLGTPTEAAQQLAQVARSKGIELEPAAIRQIDKSARTGATPEIARKNQTRINQLASEATGKKSDRVDAKFIGDRLDALGPEFERIIRKRDFQIMPSEISDAMRVFMQEVDAAPAAIPLVRNVAEKIGTAGSLTGEALQRIRTDLGRVVRTSTEPTDVHMAGQAIDILDDIVESQLRREGSKGSADLARLSEIRPQYRATKTLQTLLRRDGINPEGDLSAERLGNYLRQKDSMYSAGKSTNPLSDLGRIGETFQLRGAFEPQMARSAEEAAKAARGVGKELGRFAKLGVPAAVGGAAGGFPGAAAGLLGGFGLTGTEALMRSAQRGKPGQMIQERLGPTMRGEPKPITPPVAVGAVPAAIESALTSERNKDATKKGF